MFRRRSRPFRSFPTLIHPFMNRSTTFTRASNLALLLLLLISSAIPAQSFSFGQLTTLISVGNSLMTRVANLRAERGDYSGSERARRIAEKLNGGFGSLWWVGWDYLKNYSWREMSTAEMFRAGSDVKGVLSSLSELAQLSSDKERMAWIGRNYQNMFKMSKSLLQRLLQVFSRSGPLRDMVLILQEEVEGGLLRDCLELGTGDLKGLIQMVKDIALQFSPSTEHDDL